MTTTPGQNAPGADAPTGDEHIRAAIENAEGASDEGDEGGWRWRFHAPTRFQIFSYYFSKFFPYSICQNIYIKNIVHGHKE